MKIKIKSKQNYGTHQEEIIEEIEGAVATSSQSTTINWPNGRIIIEENKIIQEKSGNKLIIEAGKVNICNYQTEHGTFEMRIAGIEVVRRASKDTLGRAKYALGVAGAEPYTVEIEIKIE